MEGKYVIIAEKALWSSKDYKKGGDDKNKHGFLAEYILSLSNQQMNKLTSVSRSVTSLLVFISPSSSSSSPADPKSNTSRKVVRYRSKKSTKRNVSDSTNSPPLYYLLLWFLCLMDKTLANTFLLMLLLFLCLFGQASADTGEEMHQVDGVDPPYLFLIMVTLGITLGILFLVYLRRRSIIPSQECDTDSPHIICRPVDPLDTLPLSYRERTVYLRYFNTDPIHHSTDTTETSLCSYPADPPFDRPATSFGGGKSEMARHHTFLFTMLMREGENVPISSEMVAGNGLPHQRSSNYKDEMTFARNLGREVEVRIPCGSCDSDSGSCDDSLYLYNINMEPLQGHWRKESFLD